MDPGREDVRSKYEMDLTESGGIPRAAVGPGPGVASDVISREEAAVILFTILGAARRKFGGSYTATYNGLDHLLRDAAILKGRQEGLSIEIPLYMFFRFTEDPESLGDLLDVNSDWMLFFTTLFPEYVKVSPKKASDEESGLPLDSKPSGYPQKSLYVYELFQRTLELESLVAKGIRTKDAFEDEMSRVGDRLRVIIESSGNSIVFGITNRWPDRDDDFWHITMFADSTFKSTGAHEIPRGTLLKDTVHYTSERQDFLRAFVDFHNFDKPYNQSARGLLSKVEFLEYKDTITKTADRVGKIGTPYVMPAPAPSAVPQGGPVVGGPSQSYLEDQLRAAEQDQARAERELSEADGQEGAQMARDRIDAATAKISKLRKQLGRGRVIKTSSSRRPLYGPTRKGPSSARVRRHTRRKRALHSGKVGYRATRTGRKA